MDGMFRVTLLGTSCPIPLPDRFGPSTLVEAGGQALLFDAGRGVPIRLWQLRRSMASVNVLFLTHFHSDHTAGIPDIWLTGWLPPAWGHRVTPFRVIGPIGTKAMMGHLEKAYALDIKIRAADEKLPLAGVAVDAEEFAADGVVYDRDGVRVTAFAVDHGEFIKPAYGYRVDYDGRSVVISGDTRFNENLIRHATEVDLLLHEVCFSKPELAAIPAFQRIINHHTRPEEAGTVFARARPRLAAYTHLVPLGTPAMPEPTLADLVAATRRSYGGPLVVGEDLLAFDLTPGGVSTFRAGR